VEDAVLRSQLALLTPELDARGQVTFSVLGHGRFAFWKDEASGRLELRDLDRQRPLVAVHLDNPVADSAAAEPELAVPGAVEPTTGLTLRGFLRLLLGDWYPFFAHPATWWVVGVLAALGFVLKRALRAQMRRSRRRRRRPRYHVRPSGA
jgi:hypothetical protein